jgi:hypothetical protein
MAGTFTFADQLGVIGPDDFAARVPTSIQSPNELLRALSIALKLPSYFGENWNALSDCLRDLSWVTERRVILLHADIPRLVQPDLRQYLEVLQECVSDWKPHEPHELVVVFPIDSREIVENTLRGTA